MESSTLFRVGSITKILTAHMVLELLHAEEIGVASRVAELLPDLRYGHHGEAHALTIEHLLHHQGGIDGDYWNGFGDADDALATYVEQLADLGALFSPGTAWSYSNSGYVVLGRVLERLTGQSFDNLLAAELERPFSPASRTWPRSVNRYLAIRVCSTRPQW